MPDPPLIRRSLGIALRRVLPLLLAPERSDVEVVPGAPHLLVAAIVDEVGSEYAVAIVDERVCTVPFIHAEVLVEAVRNCVPRDELLAHSYLQTLDVLLRSARREHESRVARVQMRGVSYLIGHHGTADAGMLRPTFHTGLEKGAVNN